MTFHVDPRITSSSIWIGEWPLSDVYLKNEARFVWLILVPRVANVKEIFELTEAEQHQLMGEIAALSKGIKQRFAPDKLNVGALGNQVSQLHVHVIGREQTDPYWPQGVWHADYEPVLYSEDALSARVEALKEALFLG